MQLFSADAIVFSKKIKKQFDPENMKKSSSKVAHNRHPSFFLCTGLAAQTAQKQKSRTTKSPLMQDWVFRLGWLRLRYAFLMSYMSLKRKLKAQECMYLTPLFFLPQKRLIFTYVLKFEFFTKGSPNAGLGICTFLKSTLIFDLSSKDDSESGIDVVAFLIKQKC